MDPLDPPPDRYLEMGREVLRLIAGYYESLADSPWRPTRRAPGCGRR